MAGPSCFSRQFIYCECSSSGYCIGTLILSAVMSHPIMVPQCKPDIILQCVQGRVCTPRLCGSSVFCIQTLASLHLNLASLKPLATYLPTIQLTKLHLLYDPGYVIPRVGNFTEQNSRVSMSEFPTGKNTGNQGGRTV